MSANWSPEHGPLDFATLRTLYRTRRLTPHDLVAALLRRIKNSSHPNVFITLLDEQTLLARAKSLSDTAEQGVAENVAGELEYLPKRDRKRAEREGAEAAKRAGRRARSAALDQGMQLVGLWYRDVAAMADGASEVVHAVDRLDALEADAAQTDVHRLRRAVELVDDARAYLIVNPSEELLLEALAYRLARAVG